MHERADLFALDEFGQVAGGVHVEDDDGHVAVGTEGVGGLVHHFEVLGDGFVEGELVVFDGGGVFLRVGGVDAIHAGTLEEGVRADLEGSSFLFAVILTRKGKDPVKFLHLLRKC